MSRTARPIRVVTWIRSKVNQPQNEQFVSLFFGLDMRWECPPKAPHRKQSPNQKSHRALGIDRRDSIVDS
ncbi:hypothetical protein C5Y97_05320 [Blastopirellula marina]|uniref:Uncharacterized protein n=1 Tax=Blastopirellula marina TaxID=124 RepID=A0A2S8G958_9BACT|nr:hypothetical protein C5Y98_05320 [Blastopirellula marina]PTL45878.1 hypothetical protein C5Y97_05320 [Blastopirellula marina]